MHLSAAQDGKPQAPRQPLTAVKYQEVHTTFVRGTVDPAYFGLGQGREVPASVLLTEAAADAAFSSLALKTWVGDPSEGVGLYKLFSRYVDARFGGFCLFRHLRVDGRRARSSTPVR